jgi:hypothetical protein
MTVLNVRRHRIPKDAVVIMRPSKWSNAHRIEPGTTREQAISAYREDLWRKIIHDDIKLQELAELHGKDLVCCCKPMACHGDVLEQAAAWAAKMLSS